MSTSQAQAQAERDIRLPGEELTIAETLRVMDVAREMRDQRQTAEGMFQRDGVRSKLRDKLMQQAELLGEDVTDAEIDAAIEQYLSRLHTYEDPPAGLKSLLAHCWVWRWRITAGVVSVAAAVSMWLLSGALAWFFFAAPLAPFDLSDGPNLLEATAHLQQRVDVEVIC